MNEAHRLATEILKCKVTRDIPRECRFGEDIELDTVIELKSGYRYIFNPRKNLDQAVMCLEKWLREDSENRDVCIFPSSGLRWTVELDHGDIGYVSIADTLQEAICDALIQALDGKEEKWTV